MLFTHGNTMLATVRAGSNAHFLANGDLNLDNTMERTIAAAIMIANTTPAKIKIENENRHA